MEVLRLENLSKFYTSAAGVVVGLSGINLSFSVGEFVAVTGESGSGKSTMAHVLGGMLPYESGELYVNGKPTSHYDAADWEKYRRDMIGFISQSYGILAGNTVLENVSVALRLGGMDKDAANARAMELLEEVELADMSSRRASKLSSGQKQRLAIARALAKPSRILIADEPTGNLDRENSDKVISLLKRASRDRLVILITHEFDEARDVATRRIELADGIVVTDAALAHAPEVQAEATQKPAAKAKKQRLGGYVSSLTLRARPVFSAIVCLLLAFTSFITFAVLGTLTVALDDTSTKIYESDAFENGHPERLVVMKQGGEPFTEAELNNLLSVKYVQSIELRGYAHDVGYYYRPGVDHQSYTDIVNGPNYHPLLNPDDIYVKETVKFLGDDPLYIRTLPLSAEPILTDGREATDVYEVVSTDPAFGIGDTVKIYIRNNKDWSISSYLKLTFTVVGTAEGESGFYFSDKLAATLSYANSCLPENSGNTLGNLPILLLPYREDQFKISKEFVPGTGDQYVGKPIEDGKLDLENSDMIVAESLISSRKLKGGRGYALTKGNDFEFYRLRGGYNATNSLAVLVTDETYDALSVRTPDNQISLYMQDYAYADRVMDALAAKGYLCTSPFRLGATRTDPTLAAERNTTLGICAVAFLLVIVLQVLVLRAMFSSLYEHFRLLLNIGMTARSAYGALCRLLLLFAVVGEGLGAAIVAALNALGVSRIVDVFKYLEPHVIALLFVAHLISVAVAFGVVLFSMRKAVFAKTRRATDIDFSEMEEA